MNVRSIGWLAAGLVLGFALGGLSPRRQLHALRSEHEALQRRFDNRSRPNPLAAFFPRFDDAPASTAPGSGAPAPSAPDAPPASGPSATPETADARPGAQGSVAVIGEAPGSDRQGPAPGRKAAPGSDGSEAEPSDSSEAKEVEPERRGRGGRERLADFDRIAGVQRARMAASRAALISQANLDDEQVAAVDATVSRMNDRLVGYGEEVITQMATDEPPPPAQALGLGHDVSGVLYEGQQELDQIVGAAAADVEPEALEIWNYVDLEQWRPFAEARLAEGSDGSGGARPAPPAGASGAGGGQR